MIGNILYDSNCPICEKEMKYQSSVNSSYEELFICNNKCYFLQVTDYRRVFIIFGKRLVAYLDLDSANSTRKKRIEQVELEVREMIKYWKEDDRYLAEILLRK